MFYILEYFRFEIWKTWSFELSTSLSLRSSRGSSATWPSWLEDVFVCNLAIFSPSFTCNMKTSQKTVKAAKAFPISFPKYFYHFRIFHKIYRAFQIAMKANKKTSFRPKVLEHYIPQKARSAITHQKQMTGDAVGTWVTSFPKHEIKRH